MLCALSSHFIQQFSYDERNAPPRLYQVQLSAEYTAQSHITGRCLEWRHPCPCVVCLSVFCVGPGLFAITKGMNDTAKQQLKPSKSRDNSNPKITSSVLMIILRNPASSLHHSAVMAGQGHGSAPVSQGLSRKRPVISGHAVLINIRANTTIRADLSRPDGTKRPAIMTALTATLSANDDNYSMKASLEPTDPGLVKNPDL